MMISKEILSDYKEVYEKALKLVNEESKSDPPTDPYRSHYVARDLLLQMKENLKNAMISVKAEAADNELNIFTYQIALAFVYRELGRIYVFCKESATAKNFFIECLDLVKERKVEPEAVIPYIGAMNELGMLYHYDLNYNQTLLYFVESENAYKDFKATGKNPLSTANAFDAEEDIALGKGTQELESMYTLCTYYISKAYGGLVESDKAAQYTHLNLRRQMEAKSYEAIEFALDSANLSQYFLFAKQNFKQARHQLAAATSVLDEHKAQMLTPPDLTDKQKEDIEETFKESYADIGLCWASYGLSILSASKERLLNNNDDKFAKDAELSKLETDSFLFHDTPLDTYEKHIRSDYCSTVEDAKEVYHFVIKWLDVAKEYYSTDGEERDKIVEDNAELHEHLAFFEEHSIRS